jgi:hypothetical protein
VEEVTEITPEELKKILDDHAKWLSGEVGGKHANLRGANLRGANLWDANLWDANLEYANLEGANLWDANLRGVRLRGVSLWGANLRGANLRDANLWDANLRGANLEYANLDGANLRDTNLRGANLRGANLLCFGDMKHIKTMQLDTWGIGYTSDTLQIGCQRHPIDKWRKWRTKEGGKWIAQMDEKALDWAERYLGLVLLMIDACPAIPTGGEQTDE